jgi:hypothetical protein
VEGELGVVSAPGVHAVIGDEHDADFLERRPDGDGSFEPLACDPVFGRHHDAVREPGLHVLDRLADLALAPLLRAGDLMLALDAQEREAFTLTDRLDAALLILVRPFVLAPRLPGEADHPRPRRLGGRGARALLVRLLCHGESLLLVDTGADG